MELFNIILFEYILGYLIQGFAIVLGVYAFNRQKIKVKSYILTVIFIMIITCLARLLPINFGVHTLIFMVFLFLFCTLIIKMPAFKTMCSALIVALLLLIIEVIDVFAMILIFGEERFENLLLNSVDKAILGIPVSIVFAIINGLAYVILTKEKVKDGEHNGNISEKHCK